MSDCKVFVCDNGSGFVKCGYADSKTPELVIPSLVSRPSLATSSMGRSWNDVYVGEDASRLSSVLDLSHHIQSGIRNWDDMKLLWDLAFMEKLKIDCKETKILLTEPPCVKGQKERMMEVMMEEYQFSGLRIEDPPILTLTAQGLLTGLVVDSGYDATHITAVYEGCMLSHLGKRVDVGGCDVTNYLIQCLLKRGYVFHHSAHVVNMTKEKLCYVSYNIAEDNTLAEETTALVKDFRLPDDSVVTIGKERFEAPEILFQPNLNSVDVEGVAEAVLAPYKLAADIDIRREFFSHIVLSGGSTMFPGFPSRLERELKQLYVVKVLKGDMKKFKVRIEAPPFRKNLVFLGGTLLGDIRKYQPSFWISQQEYQEEGPKALEKKNNC